MTRRWKTLRASLRAKIAHVVPDVVTLYPFEVFVAALGLIVGVGLVLGLAAPTSLVMLLHNVMYWAYAAALLLGGGSVALGLKVRLPLALASGLQLLGGSFIVYAIAVIAVVGLTAGFMGAAAFTVLGLVCLIRASYFRRLVDIQRGARLLERK